MKERLRQNVGIVSVIAALVSLLGGMLLHVAADPTSSASVAVSALLVGIVLLIIVGAGLFALNRPGKELATEDEVPIPEAHLSRFLRASKFAAALYIGVRISMAYEWLTSGWAKAQNPAWIETGAALQSFWKRAVAVPPPPAQPLITYPPTDRSSSSCSTTAGTSPWANSLRPVSCSSAWRCCSAHLLA
jgi:hypothetical protein